jgi:predicted short-subunit dehydrogenase-like oxidoreductase (DUF2520 family)
MADLVIVGAGRAGGSLALASLAAGHDVVGTLTRSGSTEYGPALDWDADLPPADLLVVAVRDGAIGEVAARLAGHCRRVAGAVHVSGATPVGALGAIAPQCPVGSFHPLQTLPDPVAGAAALAGASVAVTADGALGDALDEYARSLGMRPFPLADDVRRAYHAGAAAAANFVVESLAVAADLFDAAGVPLDAARPLVEQVVDNVFELGAAAALTGPVARGDVDTVRAQQSAATETGVGDEFALLVAALARRTGQDPRTFT